ALEYLQEIGLSPEELTVSVFEKKPGAKGKNKGKRKDKYTYTDEQGKVHTWTGVGRMSNVFKKLTQEGKNLDDFLINQGHPE
ncbi:H-NS family nucleoid-associated regulatory protein, partial [Pantoea stewartii]